MGNQHVCPVLWPNYWYICRIGIGVSEVYPCTIICLFCPKEGETLNQICSVICIS
jgi:hypothetical protein